ncbi:MAG: trypsin-like peptidase domain-containing protein, partial [Pirellulaceae bacterium]|nr:trypsin-like peptidase domain-containing protein [Pirellulaceae bacterium]
MKLANNRLSTISSPGGYSQNEWWASPRADGKQGILFAGRLLDESLKESPSTLPKDTIWVPTADARFMLSVTRAGNKETSRITAHQGTAAKEFFVFEKTAPVTMSSMPTRWGYMTGEPRVMLAADLKRLTIVAEPNDRVVVRKFDAFEALGRPLRNANAKQVALLDRRGVFVPPAAPMKADDMVAFEEGHSPAVLNYSGTGHWRVFNDQLILLGPDGVKVTKQAKLPKAYTHIRERREYLVAMNTKTKDFDIIDKRTFRIQAGGKLPGLEAIDIVLHPTLPVSYVSYKADIEIPRFQFLVVDERTGKSKSNPEFLGEYMKVSPDGRYLLVGYHDIYRRGSRLILNPQRWHITPTYGSLDWLLCYDLTRTGEPIIREVKLNAGGNCQGLRLTPDGGRVVFLSFAGSPSQSKQLQALQVDKLDAEPLVFQMKEIATPTTIAFHPKRNIAASPGSGSAAFFDTKMGAEIPSLCRAIPAIVAQGEVADVWFSANGENLVFDLRIADQQHFVKAALDLSRASVRTSRSTRPRPSPRPPKSVKKADPAPLKDLTALAGDVGGDPMSPKEISREFATSVVIVANEEGSGTGFAVGENGYVLTCAHCVSHTSQNWVYFQSTPNSKPHKRTAEVVRVDVAKDMALLKIVSKLKPTRLLISGAVESGERVVVIGNPGLGELVLDQTLTEGIVSNAKRRFEGVDYMQTSAAVNPGSSGGPVFNEQGTVIGMVALKGRIEGVGFAITAEELAKFLIAGATRAGDKGKLTRLWVDSTGQFKIRASLERVLGNRVQLINDDGARSVEIDKLSERDRQFLRLLGHGK